MKIKTKIIAIMAVVVTASAQLTFVNPGSSPDATDGDTIRNAFIKCNNDFTYIGGQLNSLNSSLSGLATTYDPFGMALLMGLNATNYVRYAVGTNTVGWLGCLNAESNVLQSDITALTNNVDALWGIIGGAGSGLVMPTVAAPAPFPWGPQDAPWGPPTALVDYGSQMCFDSYKVPGQGGPGYGWTTGIRSDGFGTLSAYQFQGNLVDAAGAGNWAITDVNQDNVNAPNGGVAPVNILGFVPVSQNNGSWLWTSPSALTFLNMSFENGAIYSHANAGVTYMVVDGTFQASQLMDSYNSTPASGMVATSQGTDGTWQWQALPAFPATLNFDSGNITSDGSGNASVVSIYAQQLKDLGGNTGASGNYAQANGSGGWFWTAWPTTLDYDSGNLTSDGAGDLTIGQNLTVNGSFSSDRRQFYSDGSGDVTAQNVTIGQNLTVNGSFSSDSGQFYSDGSGNVTAQTFNPVSDRVLKEQITPLAPSNALAMILGLTNYSWRFKAHTNFTASVICAGTRMVTTNFVASGTNMIMVFSTNKTAVAITNLTAKMFPPSGREFGPMAQDWHSATGLQDGHKISATSEVGLLIGAVQGLASLQNIFTNTAGARFALVVNAQTNGFVFVPQ